MRTHLWLWLVTFPLAFPAGEARADDREEIERLVEKAIAARGGEAKLKALRAAVWKSEGSSPDRKTRASLYGQMPGQFRLESERTANGRTSRVVKVVDGGKGWITEGGKTRPLDADEMAQVRSTFYYKYLDATLLPLREKGIRLARVAGGTVEGRATVGLKVGRKGQDDVTLRFDKLTHQLVESERMVEEKPGGRLVPFVLRYSDYEDAGGVKMARRTRRFLDGKPGADVRITAFEVRPGLDPALFQPPAQADAGKP